MSACNLCGSTDGALKRCSGCKSRWYCSDACQAADWEYHRKHCGCGQCHARRPLRRCVCGTWLCGDCLACGECVAETPALNAECYICLNPLPKAAFTPACRHALCLHCAHAYAAANNSKCPACRKDYWEGKCVLMRDVIDDFTTIHECIRRELVQPAAVRVYGADVNAEAAQGVILWTCRAITDLLLTFAAAVYGSFVTHGVKSLPAMVALGSAEVLIDNPKTVVAILREGMDPTHVRRAPGGAAIKMHVWFQMICAAFGVRCARKHAMCVQTWCSQVVMVEMLSQTDRELARRCNTTPTLQS